LTGVPVAANIALSKLVLSRGSGGPRGMATSAATPGPGAGRGTLPVMPAVTRFRLDRNADRRITAGGIAVAGGFVAAALVSLALPAAARLGTWLPLHLALAGGAGVAIGSAMPFFSSALSAAPPAPARLRLATLALLAGGAIGVASRAAVGGGALPVLGGIAYLAGIVALFAATFLPLRGALGPRRPLISLAYGAALADVLAGAALGTLFLGGWLPVVGSWVGLKPAHAWLNLLGFVSLAVTGTLTHLLPTVFGGRMLPRTSSVVAIGGQETALFLGQGERVARLLHLHRLLRLDVAPVQIAPPWGVTVLDLPGRVPLPAKITVEVLPAIDLRAELGADPDADAGYDLITKRMQEALDALAEARRFPLIG